MDERSLSDELARADPDLVAAGWERRFVTGGPRADEVAGLYRELGYEVRLEPVREAEIPEGCTDCQIALLFQFKTVYTRRRPPP
ncbi:MAG TPA: hypothetical protein VLL77_00805 [Anaerolineales bacterium]|nr:hypothetical protein [Anaerolineales bacterium]